MAAKPNTLAIAAILAALATPSVSIPAFAQVSQTPGYDACMSLSVQRGSGPNMGGGTKEDSQNKTFMTQCMAGKIPAEAQANPSVARLPANTYASTVASKPINRRPASARRPTGSQPGAER
jgi:hypothetical protein